MLKRRLVFAHRLVGQKQKVGTHPPEGGPSNAKLKKRVREEIGQEQANSRVRRSFKIINI